MTNQTNTNKINAGDTVKFIDGLYADEIGAVYTVLEVNGDRCIIEFCCTMNIKPQSVAMVRDLEII